MKSLYFKLALSAAACSFVVAVAAARMANKLLKERAEREQERLQDQQAREEELAEIQKLLSNERAGRTKAERQLRTRVQAEHGDNGHTLVPIGYVNSCFPTRCGAPRQGMLCPSTRGQVVFSTHISPHALQGLEQYSHAWLIFIFDENTNAHGSKGQSAQARTFPAKVAPPQLLGKRVGLFSTRTPHRPCPVGLTLVQVISVDERTRTVEIAALDLVHDTPILDIKPYIPSYDSLPDARCASWVVQGGAPELPVAISAQAQAAFQDMTLPKSSHYVGEPALLLQALSEVLRLDIRSTHQGRGKKGPPKKQEERGPEECEVAAVEVKPYSMHFDCLRVEFTTCDGRITVVALTMEPLAKRRYMGKKGGNKGGKKQKKDKAL